MEQEQQKEIPVKKTNGVNKALQAVWIVPHIPYAAFCALLAIVYIANGHFFDNIQRDIGKTSLALKEYKANYKNLKAELMFRSKESQLEQIVAPIGLKSLKEPPQRLEVEK